MAIARLSRVVLITPRSELGVFLAKLSETGLFHPSDRSGLVQDTELVLLSSKAHAVYSDANLLLRGSTPSGPRVVHSFRSSSMTDLVAQLAERSSELSRAAKDPSLVQKSKAALDSELISVRDAALAAFKDISRVRVRPGSRRFLVVEGFVPTDRLEKFTSVLGPHYLYSEPIPRRQPGVPYVPSLVVNPKVVSLFEDITLSLGVPKYNEVDPTPIVALVFPIFFGIMFSDLGRGLVLAACGYFFRRSPRGSYRYLGRLLLVLGASAMVVGALRGLFFGLRLPYQPLLPSPSFLVGAPSLDTVTFWLEVGIVIGAVHLAAGYVLAVVNRVMSEDYAEAFLSYAPTLLLYAATVPFVFAFVGSGENWGSVFSSAASTPFISTITGLQVPIYLVAEVTFPLMVASAAVLVFGRAAYRLYSTHLPRAGLRALAQGLADALVRPAELFVHTISYVRLGILLVVESIFGELLAGLVGLGLLGILVAIPGNVIVISMMAFIVYLQDLRLNIYEWFSKFYSGVGKPFAPLVSAGRTFSVSWSPIS